MSIVLLTLFLTAIAFWAGMLWASELSNLRLPVFRRLTLPGVVFQLLLVILGYVVPLFAFVLQEGGPVDETNRAALAMLLNLVVLPTLFAIPNRLPPNLRRILVRTPEVRT